MNCDQQLPSSAVKPGRLMNAGKAAQTPSSIPVLNRNLLINRLATPKSTTLLPTPSRAAATVRTPAPELGLMQTPRSNLAKSAPRSALAGSSTLVRNRLNFQTPSTSTATRPKTPSVATTTTITAKAPTNDRLVKSAKVIRQVNPATNPRQLTARPNPTLAKTPMLNVRAKTMQQQEMDKKLARTIDCAKSIKRRSIKCLNNKLETRISRSRVSILNDMQSRCLIVTPDVMRQLLFKDESIAEEGGSGGGGENDDELIKVHTIKSSSLVKYILYEAQKKECLNEMPKIDEANDMPAPKTTTTDPSPAKQPIDPILPPQTTATPAPTSAQPCLETESNLINQNQKTIDCTATKVVEPEPVAETRPHFTLTIEVCNKPEAKTIETEIKQSPMKIVDVEKPAEEQKPALNENIAQPAELAPHVGEMLYETMDLTDDKIEEKSMVNEDQKPLEISGVVAIEQQGEFESPQKQENVAQIVYETPVKEAKTRTESIVTDDEEEEIATSIKEMSVQTDFIDSPTVENRAENDALVTQVDPNPVHITVSVTKSIENNNETNATETRKSMFITLNTQITSNEKEIAKIKQVIEVKDVEDNIQKANIHLENQTDIQESKPVEISSNNVDNSTSEIQVETKITAPIEKVEEPKEDENTNPNEEESNNGKKKGRRGRQPKKQQPVAEVEQWKNTEKTLETSRILTRAQRAKLQHKN